MKPEQIAKTTEHSQQAAFFCWLNQNKGKYPMFDYVFAIPNGGERNKIVASRLKAEGTKSGVPDVFFPYVKIRDGRVIYHGMWIEFKRPGSEGKAKGRESDSQKRWKQYLEWQNYFHFVAYTYCQAVDAIVNYIDN